MNIQQLNPWNWFKHEQNNVAKAQVPVQKSSAHKSPLADDETFPPILRLHREIDRLFDDVFSGFGFGSAPANLLQGISGSGFNPQITIAGGDRHYDIELEVPGLGEQDLSVELQGDLLLIRGEKQETSESDDKHFYRVERRYGKFQRTLNLPADANRDDITAELKNGVLKLSIARTAVAPKDVKKIAIH